MTNFYPAKKDRDRDGFFDFLPSWFDEWGHNFLRNTGIQPFAADIAENAESFTVTVDLPGVDKNAIKLDYDQGVLTVSAAREQKVDEKAEDGSYIRQERSSGSFTRRFMIDGIDEKAIHAQFTDGVLKVSLPKKVIKDSRSTTITID
ncbi:MAG: Hsp20/alpha crystallin family protein [Sporolactobacillus sp.]